MSAARTRNTASSRSRIWRCATPCSTSTWVGEQAGAPAWQRPPRHRPRNYQRTRETGMANRFKRVLVTGGAGYVGSNLVPKLLNAGHEVAVLDLFIYGEVFAGIDDSAKLVQVKGDLRKPVDVRNALADCDAVIHLACISNYPSFDLNP